MSSKTSKQFCGNCKAETIHNAMKKEGSARCTRCGYPPSSGPKHDAQLAEIRRKMR
jgi:hypothetical protein